jgi:hypothetical protein
MYYFDTLFSLKMMLVQKDCQSIKKKAKNFQDKTSGRGAQVLQTGTDNYATIF